MTSLFDLYKIGVGPSSSHTMGPMRAAHRFVSGLVESGVLDRVARIEAQLYGSLALTGIGHATDRAVLLGLSGNEPATVDPAAIESTVSAIRASRALNLAGRRAIPFDEPNDLVFHRDIMNPPGAAMQHPNGLRLTAYAADGAVLDQRTFFSIGGGFITEDAEKPETAAGSDAAKPAPAIPFPFHSAADLLELAEAHKLPIAHLMLSNARARMAALGGQNPEDRVCAGMDRIWEAMRDCMERGMATEGTLPGGLKVQRRAHRLAERLRANEAEGKASDPLAPLDWVTVYAMAVNEENAAGGRVVTAPTNGAAGVVPAVARYYETFIPDAGPAGIYRYFLASAAIGILYKENASISGAEVGCQGE
ncbi:MAG: L-serine ammonia-lyase, partial [Terracidiphilus sp.]